MKEKCYVYKLNFLTDKISILYREPLLDEINMFNKAKVSKEVLIFKVPYEDYLINPYNFSKSLCNISPFRCYLLPLQLINVDAK